MIKYYLCKRVILLDANVIYADLLASIKAYTVSCPDDTYTIVLNSRHSHEQLLRSYSHELRHIENGDFDKDNVNIIELSAHQTV